MGTFERRENLFALNLTVLLMDFRRFPTRKLPLEIFANVPSFCTNLLITIRRMKTAASISNISTNFYKISTKFVHYKGPFICRT